MPDQELLPKDCNCFALRPITTTIPGKATTLPVTATAPPGTTTTSPATRRKWSPSAWNQWSPSIGISGRLRLESVVVFNRNTHDPQPIALISRKIAIDQVGGRTRVTIANRCSGVPATTDAGETLDAHQPRHPLAVDQLAAGRELGVDSRGSRTSLASAHGWHGSARPENGRTWRGRRERARAKRRSRSATDPAIGTSS